MSPTVGGQRDPLRSPPVETHTWFHVGAIDPIDGPVPPASATQPEVLPLAGCSRGRLPETLDWLRLTDLAIGDARIDIRLERHQHDTGVTVLRREGHVEIVTEVETLLSARRGRVRPRTTLTRWPFARGSSS